MKINLINGIRTTYTFKWFKIKIEIALYNAVLFKRVTGEREASSSHSMRWHMLSSPNSSSHKSNQIEANEEDDDLNSFHMESLE